MPATPPLRHALPPPLRAVVDLVAGRRVAGGDIGDPEAVLRLLERHRLLLAVAEPGPLTGVLAGPRRRETAAVLGMQAELARVAAGLDGAGIEALALKGPAFARLVHGRADRRSCRDLDLLVRPAQEADALAALGRLGYAVAQRDDNATVLRGPGGRGMVELHTRLGDGEATFPERVARPFEVAVAVTLAGEAVRTLPTDLALAYAAQHGTRHLWRVLLWVWDMAAAGRNPAVDWAAALETARRLGVERQLALGVALADGLFGGGLPGPLAAERRLSVRAGRHAATLAPVFSTPVPETEHQAILQVGLARYIALRMALESSARARLAVAGELFGPSPRDRAAMPLPSGLAFLYPLLRAGRLAGRLGHWRRGW
ncbi:nucleotidyltransferase family protein [Azospirillum sp. RWY-5-1]|uniref:Nucleotidyltransferase family protein n=1 Tax=Azospirillum oleiclasticum TaxID=2735135 RepID=A0ABX2TM37_9PROT|nr:nucleotidyltransferase family protein [Azospirillum oleiclasticum]NYZ17137.1 nucleotidyltransferase family protein [Azospirillum oleiclasticum]NYZ24274.1 nucleotidyltransferase family protein [Azospirillum oleiclasticum]